MPEQFETCTLDVGEDIIRLSNGVVTVWFNTLVGTFDLTSADLATSYFSRAYTRAVTTEHTYDSRTMTYREVTSLDFDDMRGKGKVVVIRLQDQEKHVEMNVRLSLALGDLGYYCIVQLRNLGEELTVEALDPLVIDVDNNERIQTGWKGETLRYFKNGFHSWELSQTLSLAPGENLSHTYSVLNCTDHNLALILGFVTLADQFTTVSFWRDLEEDRLTQVVASSQADFVSLKEKGSIASEELFVLVDKAPREGLIQYVRSVSQKMKARVGMPPVGWSSWPYYFNRPDEKTILENARTINQHFSEDIRWIQLDDGYQRAVGDWETNPRFQNGLKSLVERIKSLGFKAGIWVAPFIASQHSQLFQEQPDWFVKGEDSKPLVVGENPLWLGEFYALDLTNPHVISHVRDLFTEFVEMGFEYFKIDFLHHATTAGKRHDETITRCMAFRRGLKEIRDVVGESYILACGAPLGPAIGLVDGMRIGTDIGAVWRYDWGGGVYECSINTLSRSVLHNQWWLNDPDCIIVRQDDTELTLDEVVLWATVVALSGGAQMMGDNLSEVSDARLAILNKIMPPFKEGAIAADYLVKSEPRLFVLPIESPLGEWTVVGVVNLGERDIDVDILFDEIGLSGGRPHHVFEFWSEQYEGLYEDLYTVKNLSPHMGELLCFRPESQVPAVLSTSMHYTQGAVELVDRFWDEKNFELSITVKKTTKRPEAVFFTVSNDFAPLSAFIEDESIELETISPEVVAARYQFVRGQTIRIKFQQLTE